MQIIKKLFCSHFSVNKGLIQHVVQSCYNYNITFRKLEIHTVKMRSISACYTSGRGNSLNRALFELRPLHYSGMSMMLCSILYKVVILLDFFSFEGFAILVLVKVLLQILVPWNNYLCRIVLPVSGLFLVF